MCDIPKWVDPGCDNGGGVWLDVPIINMLEEGEVSHSHILLLAIINHETHSCGYCLAPNWYLAKRMGRGVRWIEGALRKLKKLNLVVDDTPRDCDRGVRCLYVNFSGNRELWRAVS